MRTVQVPMVTTVSCGHCGEELNNEDGWWYCDPCGITWGENALFNEDTQAEFYYDDGAAPCGALPPHDNHVNQLADSHLLPFKVYNYPCDLPSGHHTREHHFPHNIIFCEGR